jgi:hypothetical protein
VRYSQRIAVIAYLSLQLLWVVGVDRSVSYGSDGATAVVLSVLALANVGLGLATGWWGAPTLPFLTLVLAIPFGTPEGNLHEPLPIWFGVLLFAPVEAVLVALGVVLRKSWERFRSPRSA